MNEGQVGIYLKYGALMDDTTGPGMHTMAPFVTEVRTLMAVMNGIKIN